MDKAIPVAWITPGGDVSLSFHWCLERCLPDQQPRPLYAAPQQPAAHPAITHCDNCGGDWLDNGLNPVGCPYCKRFTSVPVAAVVREHDGRAFAVLRPAGENLPDGTELYAAQPEQITPKQLARLVADNPDVQFSVKPRPPKPTECMNGCPDRQVCDHCQWPPGLDQQPAAGEVDDDGRDAPAQATQAVPQGWPRATKGQRDLGWTLECKFLERVTDLAASRTDYSTSMEATEQVLIAALEVLAAQAPAADGDALEDYKENGAAAVRFAPSSAHWSNELRRLFGPDARDGIDRLEERMRAAEQDAARYRWLRARCGRIADEYDGDSDQLVAIREADSHFEGWDVDPASLDRAIDTAIAAEKKKEG